MNNQMQDLVCTNVSVYFEGHIYLITEEFISSRNEN